MLIQQHSQLRLLAGCFCAKPVCESGNATTCNAEGPFLREQGGFTTPKLLLLGAKLE